MCEPVSQFVKTAKPVVPSKIADFASRLPSASRSARLFSDYFHLKISMELKDKISKSIEEAEVCKSNSVSECTNVLFEPHIF
jgi:hypothetical protein